MTQISPMKEEQAIPEAELRESLMLRTSMAGAA